MSSQDLIREDIKQTKERILGLKRELFEKKKELLQEIHQFKIGDLVEYSKTNGQTIYGYIDIINNTGRTKDGKVVIYRVLKENGNEQSSHYEIIYLFDWYKEPDPRLKVISSKIIK